MTCLQSLGLWLLPQRPPSGPRGTGCPSPFPSLPTPGPPRARASSRVLGPGVAPAPWVQRAQGNGTPRARPGGTESGLCTRGPQEGVERGHPTLPHSGPDALHFPSRPQGESVAVTHRPE